MPSLPVFLEENEGTKEERGVGLYRGGEEEKSLQKVRSDQVEGLHTCERGCRR